MQVKIKTLGKNWLKIGKMMSSERYEILQDDLDSLLERVDASLEWLAKKTHGQIEQKTGLGRCQSQLDEARSFLTEMEQEAKSAPLNYRRVTIFEKITRTK